MNPGDRVRLIANPSRVGILGNETDGPENRLRVLVTFLNGDEQFILLGALEKVEDRPLGPFGMIANGHYGSVKDLRGLMTYYRLTGKLANLIYSLNTTNTQFLAYQFKPVLHFLSSPCNGILIADEVGLGKTIEAGLIWTELRARQDAKRLLIICPAMLCEKWKSELANRFGVNAEIVDARELLTRLQDASKNAHESFAMIASMQGIRPSKGWDDIDNPIDNASSKLAQFLSESDFEDSLFDMVVIDEAHYLRNRETQTHKLGALIRPVSQNLILLSATPIQLKSTDLFNLLHLLDEDAFPYEYSFEETLKANAPIVRLRDKILNSVINQDEFIEDLEDALIARFFDDNEQIDFLLKQPPTDDYLASPNGRAELAERLDRINPLAKVVTRTLKRDVQEIRVQRMPVPIKVKMSDVEREFYDAVTSQVRDFCMNYEISTGFMLTIPQRQMSSCMAAACRGWKNKLNEANSLEIDEIIYENYGDDERNSKSIPKLGTLIEELVDIANQYGDYPSLFQNDSKYYELYENLRKYWNQYPGKKVVLFSFYRQTLRYLEERLKSEGIQSVVVHGGMDKHEALRIFESKDGPNILLSSEVASEGVDLQFSSLIINYDLPWNPMRIEQRIGRIDRIGQEEQQILIWNFVYEDTIDDRVYERLLERLDIFRQALGSMEAILGDEIRQLGYELLSHQLTPEQELQRINRATVAIENLNRQQNQLESEATNLIAHGEFIQNKVRAARELERFVRGEDIYAYVKDFLTREFPGTRIIEIENKELIAQIELSTDARVKFSEFLTNNRTAGTTSILANSPPNFLFDNRLGKKTAGIERITQEHPLVRFVSEELKSAKSGLGYFPVSAIKLASNQIPGFKSGNYVYAISRWAVSGSREIERLEYVLFDISDENFIYGEDAEQLVNVAALKGIDWISHQNDLEHVKVASIFDECQFKLDQRFKEFSEECMREDRDRINLMRNMLQHHLDIQKQKIEDRIATYNASFSEKHKRMIPAENGRLRKLTKKVQEKMAELKLKEEAKAETSFVSGGVISLY